MTMSDIKLVVIFLVVFLLVVFLIHRHRRRRSKPSIDGCRLPVCLPSLPLVGSLPFMIGLSDITQKQSAVAIPRFFLSKSKQIGDVFACYSGSKYTVILNGRKAIYAALVKKALHFADRPMFFTTQFTNPKQLGVFSGHYDKTYASWRNSVSSAMKDLGFGRNVMEERIQSGLRALIESIQTFDDQRFNPADLLYLCVARIFMSVMFGRRFEEDDPLVTFMKHFEEIVKAVFNPIFELCPVVRFFPGFRHVIPEFCAASRRMFQLVDKQIAESSSSEHERNFISVYAELEGLESVHNDQLKFAIQDLNIAGIESSYTTLRWAMIYVANHPEIQSRLHTEIDETFDDRQQLPSLADAIRLPYVEATLLEVLRIETLVPLSVPHRTVCDTHVNGVFIPENTMVLVNLYSVHMDPDEWKDPEVFRPERFIDEAGKVFGKERTIPFSLGKRSCLGEQLARQELFILLTGLLQHFEFRPPEGQSRIDVTRIAGAVIAPSAFEIRLIRRR